MGPAHGPSRAELPAGAREVVARVEAAPLPPPIRGARSGAARATWVLTAAVVAVSVTTALAVGDIGDVGVLMRTGAMVRGLVASGEWWRLVACVFIHISVMHLVLNAIGLVILGRLAEELFGGVRVIAMFGVAGVAGAVASYLASPVGLSVGASGAVFGLLGAVFVEITWHRQRYRAAWKRGMWGALAVVAVGQLGYGFLDPMIDQWAHGAGLAAGAALGFALSPNARWATAGVYGARALALVFGAFVVTAAIQVVRTPLADSLAAGGSTRHVVDGVAITAPAPWEVATGQLAQPDGLVVVKLAHEARTNPPQQIALWIIEEGRRSKNELGDVTRAREPIVALPDGWTGTELEAAPADTMGAHQRVRVIMCGRAFGDTMVVMAIQVPEVVASAAPAFFAALIASTGPA